MVDISEPTCSKCRWFKEGKTPDGGRLGVNVQSSGWNGFRSPSGQHFDALGAGYCEHTQKPRGLVLTNYSCANFERAPEINDQTAIPASISGRVLA